MDAPTMHYIKGWLALSCVMFVFGICFSLATAWLIADVLAPAHVSFIEIGIIKLGISLIVGLPISFLAFRWSVRRWVVRSLLGTPRSPAA